jgi:hypothetical protein
MEPGSGGFFRSGGQAPMGGKGEAHVAFLVGPSILLRRIGTALCFPTKKKAPRIVSRRGRMKGYRRNHCDT